MTLIILRPFDQPPEFHFIWSCQIFILRGGFLERTRRRFGVSFSVESQFNLPASNGGRPQTEISLTSTGLAPHQMVHDYFCCTDSKEPFAPSTLRAF